MNPKIYIICGATASGKSAEALKLAEKTGGVIINADSQQVYADFRILTARPGAEDEAQVPHRLYGFLQAHEPCSAGIWLKHARMETDWLLSQNKTVILCGGTGLYIKSLMQGINDIPDVPEVVRQQAKADLEAMGHEAFHARLADLDPEAAARIKPGDTQRLIRAFEVWLASGKTLSYWQSRPKEAPYPREFFELIKVELPRETLYARINARCEAMFEDGAVEEVQRLLALHLPEDAPAMRIIGVPEIQDFLEGNYDKTATLERFSQATRNYAKRQLTWFRHQLNP